jgi:monoterpene epsilon-lactone hydrolase
MLTQKVSRASLATRWSWPLLLSALSGALAAAPVLAQEMGPTSRVDATGVAHLPAIEVPASSFMSPEARAKFIALFSQPKPPGPPQDFRTRRENDERKNAPFVARDEVLWPVNIEPRVIGGVRTRIITPRSGIAPENRARVLINLHGGGFIWGEGNGALTESIPIAGVGRITVITVAYREGPEYHFPAASEDVAAVYRELLKDHRAEDIGIYGCSAGGILAAEAVAWFAKEQIPMPGAIGTFCGSIARLGGDSAHVAPPLVGERVSPGVDSSSTRENGPYFQGASTTDPLVLPINSPELLAHFPPTLLIAGSRDFTVSSLFASQAALAAAGVDAELHVWDGMWHAFLMDPDLPESRQVYQVVVRFFERHLGVTGSR